MSLRHDQVSHPGSQRRQPDKVASSAVWDLEGLPDAVIGVVLATCLPMFAELGQVRQLVSAFESCALPVSEWDHRAHLTVACWYVYDDPPKAEGRMRKSIQRYNAYNRVFTTATTGYHETLTRFWLALVHATFYDLPATTSPVARINQVVGALSDKLLVLRYYSHARIVSDDARYGWIEPDLQPLPELRIILELSAFSVQRSALGSVS